MKTIKSIIAVFICFISLFCYKAYATNYTVASVPNPYQQKNVIYVVDPENILTQQDTDTINQRLKLLETRTTIESVIVVLPSIGNIDTREFANKLFNHWNIGKKDKDNGLLILLVLDQREVVFEVGYGLEGNLTDAKSYQLMEQYMLPLFKQDQFSLGMNTGAKGVANYLEQQFYDGTLYDIGHNPQTFNISIYVILTIIVLFTVFCLLYDRIFVTQNWSNVQYLTIKKRITESLIMISAFYLILGGFASLIIMFFDFGIAIYNLIIWAINIITLYIISKFIKKSDNIRQLKPGEKVVCANCRRRSVIEIYDTLTLLTPIEQYQSNIGSVCYRFFCCQRKTCRAEFKGERINAGWKICPDCQIISKKLVNTVTLCEATENENGQIVNYYQCVKCQLTSERKIMIPSYSLVRYRHQIHTTGGVRGSGGGGRSGSSSSGSRGGGRSGGGGARGRF